MLSTRQRRSARVSSMLDVREAIEKFLDFERRASAKRTTQIARIKEDRAFLSGDQWDETDASLIPSTRSRRTVNILGNGVNSVVNQYANYPYKWYSGDEQVDGTCDAFLKTGSNQRAALDVLYSVVAFGLGYFALGSEEIIDTDGTPFEIPSLYSLDRVENVYFDPDSVAVDGSDALEAAIIEMRSKNYIRAKYGQEWAPSNGVKALVNISDNLDSDAMPIVTYYRIEDGKCVVYRLLNNDFLDDPVQLDLERVPVFPVYGERTWQDSDIIYQGLVRKGAPVQKLVNYAYTQLSERMAYAPKPLFITTGEAVEGYTEGWKNIGNNLNPLLIYNDTSEDHKIKYPEPKRIDNQVQFGDITGIISSNLELLSTITGVDSKGLLDSAPQLTATEVIYNERNVQNTTRHYYANLRDTYKAVGEAVIKLLGMGNVSLSVIQGPAEYLEKQVARQELVSLASIVPDQDKMKLVDGILMSHNDNAILRNVFGALHSSPAPTPMEQEAFATVEEMKKAIEAKDMQIQEMQDQLKRYQDYVDNNDKSIQADFLKMDLQHQHKMEEMALQSELNGGADAVKAGAEAEKAQLDLQKTAIQLDATKVKAKADIAKTLMGAVKV